MRALVGTTMGSLPLAQLNVQATSATTTTRASYQCYYHCLAIKCASYQCYMAT